ncbi:thioredoxin family protein [Flavobacterium anhuiense]|uniref:thioredoxin family protein n=1 Tax=Flavobacterium anhuiense TaxID=459526 RepID=UPI000E6B79C9|nr:thioredoxin family protein [Flavobacterium anhuiense]
MNLANKIESDQLTMINFHATWCPPCIAMKPDLDEVLSKYGEVIHYERIDIDQNPDLVKLFEIRTVPTTMLLKKGKLKWHQTGMVPADELGKVINDHV